MIREALHLLPYALLAALSPLALAATIAVMRAGRIVALAFGIAFGGAQLVVLGILVAIGAAIPVSRDAHSTAEIVLDLLVGGLLLAAGVAVRRREPRPAAERSARSSLVLERLEHVRVTSAALAGVLLGIGGPKRLVLTLLAAASIGSSGLAASEKTTLVILYAAVATILVTLPVGFFVVLGQLAVQVMADTEAWLAAHQQVVLSWMCFVFGAGLVVSAVLRIFV